MSYLVIRYNKAINYQQFAILRLPLEPSALRYITAFEIGEPFLYSYKDASSENAHKKLEFAVIKVRISILYSTIALLFKFFESDATTTNISTNKS